MLGRKTVNRKVGFGMEKVDIIKVMTEKQDALMLSDEEVCRRTGISEYTYFDLKKYRLYLTKIAYFALCHVLELPILDDEQIDSLLEKNKELVGNPTSNLKIAAEMVNPEYLEKLERELKSLKIENANIDNKEKMIEQLKSRVTELLSMLSKKDETLNEKIQQAYSDGVKEGMTKIPMMQQAENNRFVALLNEEYSEQIERLEEVLKESRGNYSSLYLYVKNYIERDIIGEKLNIDRFPQPYGEKK